MMALAGVKLEILVSEPDALTTLPRPCAFVKYRRSSGYDGLDLRYFEVTNVPHKNIKDNNIEAVKLDHCDQELP